MAGLINTGIWGFISSAKATGKKILNAAGEEIDEWVSTFVSGASGWLIDKLGNAEFKSVFVRDKFITNEFVYNRIKVTEDEEIISSSVKIASYIDNEDGTFTVYPDLREGDYNPLAEDDLVMGYYHNPGSSGVIYAVQKFKALSDPSKAEARQSTINHECTHARQWIELTVASGLVIWVAILVFGLSAWWLALAPVIFYLWYVLEWCIRKLIAGVLADCREDYDAYRLISFEREARLAEKDNNYLENSTYFAWLHFY